MSYGRVIELSDQTFEQEVLSSERAVLVDFWAPWCGPCKMIAPILDEIARDNVDDIKVAKLNVDQNREISAKYAVRGVPSLLLFKDGELLASKSGALSKAQLMKFVSEGLKIKKA